MSTADGESRTAAVTFTGTRRQLFGMLLSGYLLMLPSLGIYRFWLTTQKRRFYWQNTVIDGDPLEYSGRALQLLIGFLIALGFFLPLYLVFFYLSTQATGMVLLGYAVIAAVFWFMMGYAQYRARDFRLSRTLWRGVRFNQRGNAWGYAGRRFLWSIVVVLSVGLLYPAMASALWRYRYAHTWYGDRPFRWTGSWKTIRGPYYLSWLVVVVTVVALGWTRSTSPVVIYDATAYYAPTTYLIYLGAGLVLLMVWLYLRSREATKMFSEVWVGEAKLTVRVRARALFGQLIAYGFALTGALLLCLVVGLVVGGLLLEPGALNSPEDLERLARTSWFVVPLLVLGYLVVFGAFGLMGEVFLGCGYWMLVARGATISNIESLAGVRAADEDRALAGEGFADALNVGAY